MVSYIEVVLVRSFRLYNIKITTFMSSVELKSSNYTSTSQCLSFGKSYEGSGLFTLSDKYLLVDKSFCACDSELQLQAMRLVSGGSVLRDSGHQDLTCFSCIYPLTRSSLFSRRVPRQSHSLSLSARSRESQYRSESLQPAPLRAV